MRKTLDIFSCHFCHATATIANKIGTSINIILFVKRDNILDKKVLHIFEILSLQTSTLNNLDRNAIEVTNYDTSNHNHMSSITISVHIYFML